MCMCACNICLDNLYSFKKIKVPSMVGPTGLVAADVPGKHKESFPLKHMKCKSKSIEVWPKAQVWDQALLTSE